MTKTNRISGRDLFDIYDLLAAAERPDQSGGTAAYLNNDTLRALKDELDRLYNVEVDTKELLFSLKAGSGGELYAIEDSEDFDNAVARLVQDIGIADPGYAPQTIIPVPRK